MKKLQLLTLFILTPLVLNACSFTVQAPSPDAGVGEAMEDSSGAAGIMEEGMMNDENTIPAADDSNSMLDDEIMEKLDVEVDEENGTATIKMSDEAMEPVDGTFNITGSVSYTVQKGWLSKPTEAVTGTSKLVDGKITVENGLASVEASVNTTTLKSGSGGRDGEVVKLLGNSIKIRGKEIDINANTAIIDVTFAGNTESLPFSVTISETDGVYSASGTTTFNMSLYGIDPPSAAGIYNVADEMSVSFDITAK